MKGNLIFDSDIYLTIFSVIVLLIGLSGFIIYSILFYRKRQALNRTEKDNLNISFQQELLKTQLEVQEQTMQTIGADLHDNIGQLLSITSLTLNSIELENETKAREKIDAAIDLTVRSIKEMRLLGKLLQGDQLVELGLSEAIRYEINWIERSGKYKISYLNDGELPAANSADKDLVLFRILQEILNNIIKHAKATEITIRVDYEDSRLKLAVSDNGIGFDIADLAQHEAGMGLHNIKKRAAIIGGETAISSVRGCGTTVTVSTLYP